MGKSFLIQETRLPRNGPYWSNPAFIVRISQAFRKTRANKSEGLAISFIYIEIDSYPG